MTRMTGPDCVVMCNLINTHTHTHTLQTQLAITLIYLVYYKDNKFLVLVVLVFLYINSIFCL